MYGEGTGGDPASVTFDLSLLGLTDMGADRLINQLSVEATRAQHELLLDLLDTFGEHRAIMLSFERKVTAMPVNGGFRRQLRHGRSLRVFHHQQQKAAAAPQKAPAAPDEDDFSDDEDEGPLWF